MEKPAVSLICPAYHDEKNIGPLVRRCVDVLRPVCREFEIVIVEDGSPDATGRAADELAAELTEVAALHHPRNLGHGAALGTGLRNAVHPVIAFMDGDGQYEPADLPVLLAKLGEYDLVQGRRTKYPNGVPRAVLSKIYNLAVRAAFGAPFSDLGCSIKVFKRDILKKAMPVSDGIFMQGELVVRAFKSGYRVGEEDVSCYPRLSGKSHSLALKNVARMVVEMKRLSDSLKVEAYAGKAD